MFSRIIFLVLCFSLARAEVSDHITRPFSDSFDKKGIMILAVGTLATALAFGLDNQTHDNWKGHQRMSEGLADIGDFWGQGWIPGSLIGVQLGFDRNNGIASAEGVLASTAVTFGMKYSVRRERPDSNTKTSFPSGHSQMAFSYATTVLNSYGFWASVPAYGMAVLTGFSRLADNAHWLSDVVAGATIGVLFGRGSFEHHLNIVPMTFDNLKGGGFMATARF